MSNKQVSPVIRFKGFTDDWQEKQLGEVADLYRPATISSQNFKSSGVPVFGANNYVGFYSKANHMTDQVVVSARGNVGISSYVKGPSWITGNAMVINVDKYDINKYFLYSLLSAFSFRPYVTGGVQKQLNPDKSIFISVALPSLEEQAKIGTLFSQLDALITKQQQQLEYLKDLKKGSLQRMFPKNGASVPEIRFKGFTDDWQEKKLGDVADIISGGTPSTNVSTYWDGDIDWYSPAELNTQIYLHGSKKKISELGLLKSSAKIHPVGTILFTSRAGIGKTAILAKKGATNQGFQSIIPNKSLLDTYFIFSKSNTLKHYGNINGAGSTFKEVTGKQMAKMPLALPSLEEQTKIGQYFKQLDKRITQQETKVKHLQDLKKGLLQKLFV